MAEIPHQEGAFQRSAGHGCLSGFSPLTEAGAGSQITHLPCAPLGREGERAVLGQGASVPAVMDLV